MDKSLKSISMKNTFLIYVQVILIVFLSCTPVSNKSQKINEHIHPSDELIQNNTTDEIIIEMLKEFYSAHNAIMLSKLPEKEKTDSVEFALLAKYFKDERIRISDSLKAIHCFDELRNISREYLEEGFDLLTLDRVGLLSNENLNVVKDSTSENSFIVSFLASDFTPGIGIHKQQVILNVQVIKEGESYKIHSVMDHGSYWIKEED
jgi:hypothetical protein